MSNLEDVFLKINKEYAPDLFKDLKELDSQNSSVLSDNRTSMMQNSSEFAPSIAHSDNTADQSTSLLNKDSRDSKLQNSQTFAHGQ